MRRNDSDGKSYSSDPSAQSAMPLRSADPCGNIQKSNTDRIRFFDRNWLSNIPIM